MCSPCVSNGLHADIGSCPLCTYSLCHYCNKFVCQNYCHIASDMCFDCWYFSQNTNTLCTAETKWEDPKAMDHAATLERVRLFKAAVATFHTHITNRLLVTPTLAPWNTISANMCPCCKFCICINCSNLTCPNFFHLYSGLCLDCWPPSRLKRSRARSRSPTVDWEDASAMADAAWITNQRHFRIALSLFLGKRWPHSTL